jgi:phosphate transport system permease protein
MSNIKKVKLINDIASFFIRGSGGLVIFCVILIIVMIFKVALPLFLGPEIQLENQIPLKNIENIVRVGFGDYKDSYYTISDFGELNIYSLANPSTEIEKVNFRETKVSLLKMNQISKDTIVLHWVDGYSVFLKIYSKSIIEHGKRVNKLSQKVLVRVQVPYLANPEEIVTSIDLENGRLQRIYSNQNKIYSNFMKYESDENNVLIEEPGESQLIDLGGSRSDFLTLSANGEQLWVANKPGNISRYRLVEDEGFVLAETLDLNKEISAIGNVYGDYSLLVAHTDGELNSWIAVRLQTNSLQKAIVKSHFLLKAKNPIVQLQGSFQDKTYFAYTDKRELYHGQLTTEKKVFKLNNEIQRFGFSGKANTLAVLTNKELLLYHIENPYQEISFSVLFKKVWYENYSKPEYVWQSGGGGDDSEGKYSLMPLIFGTLKGTLYAMLLSIPLALGSAIYISQFATATLRNYIKPMIEMMSAIPSVVVGFIAALWLAPKVDGNLLLVFLSLPLFMLVFIINLLIWNYISPHGLKTSGEKGKHVFYFIPTLLVTFFLLYYVGPILEEVIFGGDFKSKLIDFFKIEGYEQRNCLIIGFALGFTVIPIIFSIAEDVLSSVPRSLMANSLALGANRWQSVWRVILPSASPGIVAGVIIGFGRAIGETMIVLMATGNTPIMDVSIFNGMRTLSANIAVEIGEAPFEGALYRTLFLSAVILFIMTFILNTGAELTRQALRKKYSQF